MEAISEAPDESSGHSSIIKSEDGNTQQEEGRSSPPPNCAICLGRCRNKSFTDSCLHQFCFKCLLTWSRVKTECPLCKQNFKSIIHNVKSNHQYEEYPVQQPQSEDRRPSLDINDIVNAARRFRYRTTLTLPRRETMAIQQFLMHYPLAALVNDLPPRSAGSRDRLRRSPSDFRRTVYRHNLWARPLPDFTGRFRDCSPEFFRYNDSQIHRLIPWLNRELYYLLNENSAHITYVVGRIVELLPQCAISSPEFRSAVTCYFGDRTDHFLHEFRVFASTPYDITGYDRHVQYRTESRSAALVSEVLSSSDSDSHDSDIVMVTSSHAAPGPSHPPPAAPPPGAASSTAPAPAYPHGYIPQPAVIPIETISHSDSDSDSSEVMVVGYIKPPHQRTPELVDLLGSDSDVVVQETTAPAAEPAPRPAPTLPEDEYLRQEAARREALVRIKLSLPNKTETSGDSIWHDSDSESVPSGARRRRRRLRRGERGDRAARRRLLSSRTFSPNDPRRTPPFSSDDEDSYEDSTHESSSSSSSSDRARRRKPRRKAARPASTARPERRSPRQRRSKKRSGERQTESVNGRKGKSRNGKGVKSSSVNITELPLPPAPATSDGASGSKRKNDAEPALPRGSRESKRLKSVVKVMRRISDTNAGASSSKGHIADRDIKPHDSKKRPKSKTTTRLASRASTSSSDDNIPLRLALSRSHESNDSD